MDALKAAVVLFVAVVLQVSVLPAYRPLGGTADLLLVSLLGVALLRGSVFGAVAGFGAGLLLDVAHLAALGFTSLLLTLGGFWIGRYGEPTARDRAHAPYLSVGGVTVLGEAVPAHAVLAGLPASVLLNLILTWPVYGLVRRLFPPPLPAAADVRLLGPA